MFKKLPLFISVSIAASFNVSAGTQSFDARSTGMGGIGASSSDYLTASFHNPALLAKFKDDDDAGVLLPYVGAQIQDKDKLIDQLDDFSDLYDSLDVTSSPSDALQVLDALKEMQGDSAYVQAGVGGVIAVPSHLVSYSFFAKAYGDAVVIADIDPDDLNLSNIEAGTLGSQGITMGVGIIEIGSSLAKSFNTEYGIFYAGISPKYQQVHTINYVVNIEDYNFDDWDDKKYRNKEGNFNADLGVAFALGTDYGDGVVLALAAKNIIKKEYDTVTLDNGVKGTYVINPIYTTSLSYNHEFFTLGIDIDLNENERYKNISGLKSGPVDSDNDNTQLAGMGIEFDAWQWAQLRAGYQHDIAGALQDQYTAGLGFSPWGVFHIDLGASYAGKNQFGGALQTAFTF